MQYMQSFCSCTYTKYFSRYWHIYILIPCPKHALTLNIEALHSGFLPLIHFTFSYLVLLVLLLSFVILTFIVVSELC